MDRSQPTMSMCMPQQSRPAILRAGRCGHALNDPRSGETIIGVISRPHNRNQDIYCKEVLYCRSCAINFIISIANRTKREDVERMKRAFAIPQDFKQNPSNTTIPPLRMPTSNASAFTMSEQGEQAWKAPLINHLIEFESIFGIPCLLQTAKMSCTGFQSMSLNDIDRQNFGGQDCGGSKRSEMPPSGPMGLPTALSGQKGGSSSRGGSNMTTQQAQSFPTMNRSAQNFPNLNYPGAQQQAQQPSLSFAGLPNQPLFQANIQSPLSFSNNGFRGNAMPQASLSGNTFDRRFLYYIPTSGNHASGRPTPQNSELLSNYKGTQAQIPQTKVQAPTSPAPLQTVQQQAQMPQMQAPHEHTQAQQTQNAQMQNAQMQNAQMQNAQMQNAQMQNPHMFMEFGGPLKANQDEQSQQVDFPDTNEGDFSMQHTDEESPMPQYDLFRSFFPLNDGTSDADGQPDELPQQGRLSSGPAVDGSNQTPAMGNHHSATNGSGQVTTSLSAGASTTAWVDNSPDSTGMQNGYDWGELLKFTEDPTWIERLQQA